MDCKDCGACCLGQSISVEKGLGDTIPDQYLDKQGCLKLVQGHCTFFNMETRLCDHYEQRPYVCRRFVPGSARCLFIRLWAEVTFDWFNPANRTTPSEDSLLALFDVVINNEDLTVQTIPGVPGEIAADPIKRYNEAILSAPCW